MSSPADTRRHELIAVVALAIVLLAIVVGFIFVLSRVLHPGISGSNTDPTNSVPKLALPQPASDEPGQWMYILDARSNIWYKVPVRVLLQAMLSNSLPPKILDSGPATNSDSALPQIFAGDTNLTIGESGTDRLGEEPGVE